MNDDGQTVGDYIERLKQFPIEWRVVVDTRGGGGVSVEHREIRGEPVIAIFATNGGRFGENPLTDRCRVSRRCGQFESGNLARK